MKKNDIKKYFVGELYLSYENRGCFCVSEEQKLKTNQLFELKLNGAIDFQDRIFKKVNFNKDRYYNGVLTIFYKINDNKYMCLHNGKTYSLTGNDFCKNLIHLQYLLPKISYDIPTELSNIEALILFKNLFKTNFSKIAYNNEKYSIDEFYVGNFNLPYKIHKNNSFEYFNLAEKQILYKSDSKLISFFGQYGKNYLISDKPDIFDYISSCCVFYRNNNDSLYNINSFQYCNNGTLKKEHLYYNESGESYYDYIIPFSEYLEENKLLYNKKEITIPKVLKFYRKPK